MQEAESMTIGDEGTESSKFNVGPDLQTMLQDDEDDKKFKSALDEANDVLRELDEMTQGEVTRELQVYEDTKATATVDVPRATSLIDGLEETNNNFETTADVKSGKWKTEEEEVAEKLEAERIKRAKKGMVWEVKVGDGSGATASSKVSSLAARLKRGDKPKVAKEEARKRSKRSSRQANKRAKVKSAQALAREKEMKRRAVLERRRKAKEADKARRALLGKKQVKIPTAKASKSGD